MNLLESFRSGLQAILANRLRSGLTMLGIMIGVAAVIVLVAFGQGASNAVTGSIEGLGTNLITVFPGAAGGSQADASLAVKDLTVDDAVALNDQVLSPENPSYRSAHQRATRTAAQLMRVPPPPAAAGHLKVH